MKAEPLKESCFASSPWVANRVSHPPTGLIALTYCTHHKDGFRDCGLIFHMVETAIPEFAVAIIRTNIRVIAPPIT